MFSKWLYFKLILLILNTFTFIAFASDYCIILKDGRKILAEDHWYEKDKLHAEINGNATVVIDKENILQIFDTEKFDNNDYKEKEFENILSKYKTDGAIFILTNGKSLSVRKSWVEDLNVRCLINQSIITVNFNEIETVQPYKPMDIEQINIKDHAVNEESIISNKKNRSSKTKNLTNSNFFLKDGPTYDFIKDGVPFKFIGYTKRNIYCFHDDCPPYGQWYQTEDGTEYYWNFLEQKLYKDIEGWRLKRKNSYGFKLSYNNFIKNEIEPPNRDFIKEGIKYKYIGKIYCSGDHKHPSCKLYEAENGKQYYWHNYRKRFWPR